MFLDSSSSSPLQQSIMRFPSRLLNVDIIRILTALQVDYFLRKLLRAKAGTYLLAIRASIGFLQLSLHISCVEIYWRRGVFLSASLCLCRADKNQGILQYMQSYCGEFVKFGLPIFGVIRFSGQYRVKTGNRIRSLKDPFILVALKQHPNCSQPSLPDSPAQPALPSAIGMVQKHQQINAQEDRYIPFQYSRQIRLNSNPCPQIYGKPSCTNAGTNLLVWFQIC